MFQIEMPTKITIELIMDDKGLYESGTYENLETHLNDFQDLAKNFPYVKECNIICIVREGGRRVQKEII
jgi:hypothetical protein